MSTCDCGAHKVKDAFHAKWCYTITGSSPQNDRVTIIKPTGIPQPHSLVIKKNWADSIFIVKNITKIIHVYSEKTGSIMTRPGESIDRTYYPDAAEDLEKHNEKFK